MIAKENNMDEPANHALVLLGSLLDNDPWNLEVYARDDENAKGSTARWYLTGTGDDGKVRRVSWDWLQEARIASDGPWAGRPVKYRVKLKTTVTGWAEVEINEAHRTDETEEELREWAADDAVDLHGYVLSEPLKAAGLEHGPIELAYEELDESVEAVG